jgi:hypothetical protein
LLEEPLQDRFILRDMGVDFPVGAFKVGIGHEPRTAVPRTGNVDDVQVVLLDEAIEMHIDEIQALRSPLMPQEARLDVLQVQWLFEERIGVEINLSHRSIAFVKIGAQQLQASGPASEVACRKGTTRTLSTRLPSMSTTSIFHSSHSK